MDHLCSGSMSILDRARCALFSTWAAIQRYNYDQAAERVAEFEHWLVYEWDYPPKVAQMDAAAITRRIEALAPAD